MSNTVFAFHKFKIEQDRCAMKVGTDGVLLGAWGQLGHRILDIGCGSGLISMMMAQRAWEEHIEDVSIVGIDIDTDACSQASENVEHSVFSDYISIHQVSLQDFAKQIATQSFDSIISNPPFFINSLNSPDAKRSIARHADTLNYRELFDGVSKLLTDNGVFSVIVPRECLDKFLSESVLHGFFLARRCAIKTTQNKQPKRFLLSFSKHSTEAIDNSTEILQNLDGTRSDWYHQLTESFYLR